MIDESLTVNGNTIFRTAFGESRNLVILFLIGTYVTLPNGHIRRDPRS
jgi:hypothetical protein